MALGTTLDLLTDDDSTEDELAEMSAQYERMMHRKVRVGVGVGVGVGVDAGAGVSTCLRAVAELDTTL